jgi:antitoxin component HigA of HigAB toxin-antitoxin module
VSYEHQSPHFIAAFEKPLSPKVSGLKALKFLVEENGLSSRELSRILGASPMLGGMILRGERDITASHARTLGKHFAVDPGLFL